MKQTWLASCQIDNFILNLDLSSAHKNKKQVTVKDMKNSFSFVVIVATGIKQKWYFVRLLSFCLFHYYWKAVTSSVIKNDKCTLKSTKWKKKKKKKRYDLFENYNF